MCTGKLWNLSSREIGRGHSRCLCGGNAAMAARWRARQPICMARLHRPLQSNRQYAAAHPPPAAKLAWCVVKNGTWRAARSLSRIGREGGGFRAKARRYIGSVRAKQAAEKLVIPGNHPSAQSRHPSLSKEGSPKTGRAPLLIQEGPERKRRGVVTGGPLNRAPSPESLIVLRGHAEADDVGCRDDDEHAGPEQADRFRTHADPFAQRQPH